MFLRKYDQNLYSVFISCMENDLKKITIIKLHTVKHTIQKLETGQVIQLGKLKKEKEN